MAPDLPPILTDQRSTLRELSDSAVLELARALAAYLAKPDNRGVAAVLDSKDLGPADRAAAFVALGDLEGQP
jgi:hypothetical protein